MKNHNGGVICCQGCYKIGYKSGRESFLEEIEKMIDERIIELREEYNDFNSTTLTLKAIEERTNELIYFRHQLQESKEKTK